MKNMLRKIIAGIMACTMISATGITVCAKDTANLYQNIQGGPIKLKDTLEIYKNTGNSYYAECTAITNGVLEVTGNNNTPDPFIRFYNPDTIDFVTTSNSNVLTFTAEWRPSNSGIGRASVTIGA